MQNNPDVNSPNVGREPEGHPESIDSSYEDSQRSNIEGMKDSNEKEENKSVEESSSTDKNEEGAK